jgi:molecular chaperone DnaJ
VKLKIPEGTQTGKQFRLKDKGMPVLNSREIGDLYIQTTVETPIKLSKKQKELLKEFEAASSKDTNPESSGFFARVKEFWDGFQA